MTRLLTSTERAVYIAETPSTPLDLATVVLADFEHTRHYRRMAAHLTAEFAAGNIIKIDTRPLPSPAGDPA